MMKDEWEKLVSSKPTVNLAKVSDNFVKPEDNIAGYPTLKLFKNEIQKQLLVKMSTKMLLIIKEKDLLIL